MQKRRASQGKYVEFLHLFGVATDSDRVASRRLTQAVTVTGNDDGNNEAAQCQLIHKPRHYHTDSQ